MREHPRLAALACLHATALALSCAAPREGDGEIGATTLPMAGPAEGTEATLDIASWNINTFGDTTRGPRDEDLQLANTRDVLLGADMDVWGVAEIVGERQFDRLKAQLPGYAGLLATSAAVTGGSRFYGAAEQKVGVLYKTSVAALEGARVILTENKDDFAGRPPLEVRLAVTLNGATERVTVVVLHAKAFDDDMSWRRRRSASRALKAYLDAAYPAGKALVIGDFNDDVDTSITPGRPSPYRNFVDDWPDYTFVTGGLSDAGISSTTRFPDMVDHHLITGDLDASYVAGSAMVYEADRFIPRYGATTSDHFPVFSRYTWSSGGAGPRRPSGAPGRWHT